MLLNVIPEGKVPLNLDGKSKISGKVKKKLLFSSFYSDCKTSRRSLKVAS